MPICTLSTLCLLSMRHDEWHGLDPHIRRCIYPGGVHLQTLIKLWLNRRRMQMEIVEHLVDLLGGLDLKPKGTDDGHEVTDMWALQDGDHVIVSNGCGSKVYHHAIYVGRQEGHSQPCFADMGRYTMDEDPRLRIVEYSPFMRNYKAYYIVKYNTCTAAEEAAARSNAVELAVKLAACPVSQVVNKYDVLRRNCECFAWFCKTGGQKQTSDQVEAIMRFVQKDLKKKDSVIMATIHGASFVSGLSGSCVVS